MGAADGNTTADAAWVITALVVASVVAIHALLVAPNLFAAVATAIVLTVASVSAGVLVAWLIRCSRDMAVSCCVPATFGGGFKITFPLVFGLLHRLYLCQDFILIVFCALMNAAGPRSRRRFSSSSLDNYTNIIYLNFPL